MDIYGEGMEETLKLILTKLDSLEQGQTRLEQGQARLESDVSILKDDVSVLKKDVIGLKEGQTRLESDVTSLKEGQTRLEGKMDKLSVRVEAEVIDKIRSLYDGREQSIDKFDVVMAKLDKVSRNTEHLVLHVNYLRHKAK
jgi:chromosome segregation ATPase